MKIKRFYILQILFFISFISTYLYPKTVDYTVPGMMV